jgi:hypothetical protein
VRSAAVVGLDFSSAAIEAAQAPEELGRAWRARFVHADLYDAPEAISEPGAFDIVCISWGMLAADIARWAEIVAHFWPGGALYSLKDILPRWCSPTKHRAGMAAPASSFRTSRARR